MELKKITKDTTSNLDLYNAVRAVPQDAQHKITGGRLSGLTDISPMWRIEELTNKFGICGFGWKYEIVDQRLEMGAGDEIKAFVTINLYVKVNDQWSDAIPGIGGNSFVTKESRGLHTNDDCFKSALSDAIGIACKALGFGADIYYGKGGLDGKYGDKSEVWPNENTKQASQETKKTSGKPTEKMLNFLYKLGKNNPELVKTKMEELFGKSKSTELNFKECSKLIEILKEDQDGKREDRINKEQGNDITQMLRTIGQTIVDDNGELDKFTGWKILREEFKYQRVDQIKLEDLDMIVERLSQIIEQGYWKEFQFGGEDV